MDCRTLYLRKGADGRWGMASARTAQFEAVRYSDGSGRVYHLPDEQIAVQGAHVLRDATQLVQALDCWLADKDKRTIQYS